jgi:hypothetical protein
MSIRAKHFLQNRAVSPGFDSVFFSVLSTQ